MGQLEMFNKPKATQTQKQMILNHLVTKGTISALEALSLYRINRLAARVDELRKLGHNIVTDMKVDMTGKRYARYRML